MIQKRIQEKILNDLIGKRVYSITGTYHYLFEEIDITEEYTSKISIINLESISEYINPSSNIKQEIKDIFIKNNIDLKKYTHIISFIPKSNTVTWILYNKKKCSGGARDGAGRKKIKEKTISFRPDPDVSKLINEQSNKTEFINTCILAYINKSED